MTRSSRFDYVIVGGGTAGCVLANRLSADPIVSVALLEAGPADHSWMIRMPIAMARLCQSERFNWCYWSKPESGLNGRRIYCPRGRVLGGSSAINGMVHVRGHREDFERWAALGCRGWGYHEVLPYFKRSESYDRGGDAYRGGSGPLRVSRAGLAHPLDQAFIAAGSQAGHGTSDDFNGGLQEGFGAYDRTIVAGQRVSAADAYLGPVANRPNLTVRTSVQAARIRLQGNRAVGVDICSGNDDGHLSAEREVILCAGAVGSPQILELSGIGDADVLKRAGVEPRHHLPGVGNGLQNHIEVVLQYACRQPVTWLRSTRPLGLVTSAARWFMDGSGFCGSNHWEAGAFLKSREDLAYPNLQFIFFPLALKPGTVEPASFHGFQVHVGLQRSTAKGAVHIATNDPLVPPQISFRFLQDQNDQWDLRSAIRMAREIIAQHAFDPYRGVETLPGPDVLSDAELNTWIAASADNSYHMTSSCPMGADEDPNAVVDPACRVIGLEGLRVVDASIMPEIVNSNTNAAVTMIAERAADLIIGRQP